MWRLFISQEEPWSEKRSSEGFVKQLAIPELEQGRTDSHQSPPPTPTPTPTHPSLFPACPSPNTQRFLQWSFFFFFLPNPLPYPIPKVTDKDLMCC